MDWQPRASEALERCEGSLRALTAEAAQTGDYEAVLSLTSLASEVGKLRNCALGEGRSARSQKQQPVAGVQGGNRATRAARRKPGKTARVVQRGRPAGYPRFSRKGLELLKIGWSKSSGAEYEHRVPKAALDRVVATLAEAAARKDLVRVDERLKGLEQSGGEAIPTYQVYVALAWLRKEGLIRQHGRKGYSLARPLSGRDVEQRWNALVERA